MVKQKHVLPILLLAGLLVVVVLVRSADRPTPASSLPTPAEDVSAPEAIQEVPSRGRLLEATVPPEEAQQQSVASEGVVILVRRVADGDPIAGARVSLDRDGPGSASLELLGETDLHGALNAGRADLVGAVVASADGYVSAQVEAAYHGSQVVVELTQATAIEGFVRKSTDSSPIESARVIAWPSRSHPPLDFAQRALEGDVRCLFSQTDQAGYFRLEGADASVKYTVSAGAPGWAAWPPASGVLPGAQLVEMTLRPLFGVIVEVVGEGGERLRVDPTYMDSGPLPFTCLDATATYLAQPNWCLQLAGVRSEPTWGRLAERHLLYVGESEAERVGPIRFSAGAPGYVSSEEELFAERVEDRVATHLIELTRVDAETTDVQLEFLTAFDRPTLYQREPLAYLRVVNEAEGEMLTFALPDLKRRLIEGVPVGEYYVQLEFPFAGVVIPLVPERDGQFPLTPITGDSDRWLFDLSAYGAAEVILRGPAGTRYAGPASLTFFRGSPEEGGAGGHVSFYGPPYRIPVLGAGDYTVIANHPEAAEAYATLSVYPGRTNDLRLSLK